MRYHNRNHVCCFSGYRSEKMPAAFAADVRIPTVLYEPLIDAVQTAYTHGYHSFLTGMSTGFDLWAAQAVLILRHALPISLYCVQPFAQQSAAWTAAWKQIYDAVLQRADDVFCLFPQYESGCFYARNRFLVDAASHLICYYDGAAGGTQYTVRYAVSQGLSIHNLAEKQLSFFNAFGEDLL